MSRDQQSMPQVAVNLALPANKRPTGGIKYDDIDWGQETITTQTMRAAIQSQQWI